MTACVLALGIITCTSTAPRLTPTEAARILVASSAPYAYVPPVPLDGPIVVTNHSRPGDGPWEGPEPQPARRLDGTLLTTPPTMYGVSLWPGFSAYSPAGRILAKPRRMTAARGLTSGRVRQSSNRRSK